MLFNDPKTFREDMLKGYVAAYPDYVVEVPGGVARATKMPEDKITVINGGGSGHYPAFCGIIGDGFMDATVVGNVFTSPSTEDVLGVAHSVDNGNGIFIVGGNYAGDKMNFNMARDRLIEEGVDCRTFYITDDVAAAKPEDKEKRRGNVGTFMVFKAAGAAAAAGVSFDELVRITEKANERTRTMSMGFRGCTLPGEAAPLFHVPEGKMEVGQGIHGEPGVGEDDLKSASEVAKILVDRVLAEAPADDSKRIAVILDGLGSTKYEELFVVWGTVRELLEEKGYKPVVYRFFCLQSHYRKSLVFTWENLDNAVVAYNKLIEKIAPLTKDSAGDIDKAEYDRLMQSFRDALDNDINTAMAITVVYDVLKSKANAATKLALIGEFDKVLGLVLIANAKELADNADSVSDDIPDEVLELVEQRKAARKDKNFALADELRDKIAALGYEVKETRQGTEINKIN